MIVIDPGHGGTVKVDGSSPNNATGPDGLLEKIVTLEVALRAVAALVAAGQQVKLTRETDVNLGLHDRAAVAKAVAAPAFVSIHFNGDADNRVQGTETWTHSLASAASIALARIVQSHTVAATGYRDRGVKAKVLGVLDPESHDSHTAACLVEVSFLTDPKENARLRDPASVDAVGQAIAGGIQAYLATLPPTAIPRVAKRVEKRRRRRARKIVSRSSRRPVRRKKKD
jgi:N-acetylmuramoyl-L-alanine amidase